MSELLTIALASYSTGDVMLFAILVLVSLLVILAIWGHVRP